MMDGVEWIRTYRRPPIVACIARMVALKGHKYLLDASYILHDRGRTHILELVGHGPLRHDLEIQANTLGIRSFCWFRGKLPHNQIPNIMRRARVVVLPSLMEGLGLVLVEAQACGTPVVGSRVGGIPETMAEGKSGFTCNPADSEDMAEKIERFF